MHLSKLAASFFLSAAPLAASGSLAQASELLTIQGDSYVDITRSEPEVHLNVVDSAGGVPDAQCGFKLRTNNPFGFAHGLADLAKELTVTERGNGELTADPISIGLSLTYLYSSKSAYGTTVTIATKNGDTLANVIAAAFSDIPLEADGAKVIVTLIPCIK